jgi:hypothetical protein
MTDTGEFLNRIALFYAETGSSRLMRRFLVWLVISGYYQIQGLKLQGMREIQTI